MRKLWLVVALVFVQLAIVSPVSANGGDSDRVVLGGSVIIDVEDVVGDLAIFGGSAKVLGSVKGDLVVFGGNASVSGQVQGSIVVFGGTVDLKSTSFVGKDVVTFGGTLRREQGSTVGGSTVRGIEGTGFALPALPSFPFRPGGDPLWGFFSSLLRGFLSIIVLLGVAVLSVAMFPRQLEVTENVLESAFWQCVGFGLLTWVAAIFLTPILVISIIGIPVVILLWIVLFLAALFGIVAVANLVGERVLRAAGARPVTPLMNAVLGVLVIMIVAVPFNAISGGCLGSILLMMIVTPSIGALVLSRFGTMRWYPRPPGTSSLNPTPPPSGQPPTGGVG